MAKQPAAAPNYTVLARRYRPQQFDDLVGQEAVARALRNALECNRVAHAYLFTGARGVGKTSTARILAKALNCVKGPTPTPCDACDICQSIAAGEDVDVLEIDGASNNRIDEIREIRQNVHFRPSRSRYKIYIIDEVHMLTTAAFNGLLKTLEEPPAHVKFIFATTEVQKIPVTILSRCQRFDFIGIGTPRIVERLRQIVAEERLAADDEALELIARRAGGSMRDAQSLLDQLLAFGSDQLTSEQVHHLLGTAQPDRVVELAEAILQGDARQALDLVGAAADAGLQLGELLDQLIDYWRDLMVVHCAGTEAKNLSVPSRFRAVLQTQAKTKSVATILAGLDILATTKTRLRGSGQGRVLLEMAVVRLAHLEDLVPISQLVQLLHTGNAGGTTTPTTRSPTPRLSASPPPSPAPATGAGKKKEVTSPLEPAPTAERIVNDESLAQLWPEVLAQLGKLHASNLEKAGLPAILGPNTLVLRFSAEYNHQREMCQAPERVQRVEQTLQKLTGRPWHLRLEGGTTPITSPSSITQTVAHSPPADQPLPRHEAEQAPLIQRAVEVLGANLVRVDEGFGTVTPMSPDRSEDSELEES
ncbi:MAG: DNA polymerase III subunit gamma/tau [Gemmataceae bacterium]